MQTSAYFLKPNWLHWVCHKYIIFRSTYIFPSIQIKLNKSRRLLPWICHYEVEMKVSNSSTQTTEILLRFTNPEGVLVITDIFASLLIRIFPCHFEVRSVHPGSLRVCSQEQNGQNSKTIFMLFEWNLNQKHRSLKLGMFTDSTGLLNIWHTDGHDSSTACNKSQMCRTNYMPVTHAEYTSLPIWEPSLELVQVPWRGYGIARNPEGRCGTD